MGFKVDIYTHSGDRVMLSTPVGEISRAPLLVDANDKVGGIRPSQDIPLFFKVNDSNLFVVNRHHFFRASPNDKISRFSVKIRPASPDTPLYEIARLMLKHGIDSYPVQGEKISGVTDNTIIKALQSTGGLAKREAKTVMSPCIVVKESRLKNAKNIASKNGLEILPIVNDSQKFIGTWVSGKYTKRPSLVREGTRIKLIVDKVSKNPVVVIDKRRHPVGVITKMDLIELAASFKEQGTSIFYLGMDSLSEKERQAAKALISSSIKKIGDVARVMYANIHVAKKGIWAVKIKVSTSLRTFLSKGEAERSEDAFSNAVNHMVKEVFKEKDKRIKFRNIR